MRQVVVNDLVFGNGRMKICVPVCEKTTEAVLDAVKEVKTTPADLIEWRIDYFDEDMFAAAPEIFKTAAPLPVLCTFRTKAEGGGRCRWACAAAKSSTISGPIWRRKPPNATLSAR